MKKMLMFVLLAACNPSWDPQDFPGAPIRTYAPSGMEALWRAEVEQTILLWELAVEPFGCPAPFRFAERGEDAYPITLISDADWDRPGSAGTCWSDRIDIRLRWNRAETLAHELGHAMGLGHHDMSKGISLMDEVNERRSITSSDAMAAACMLGCGPCDTIENYNQGF